MPADREEDEKGWRRIETGEGGWKQGKEDENGGRRWKWMEENKEGSRAMVTGGRTMEKGAGG